MGMHLAVLGDPIEHSRSPAIQTAALAMAGIEGEYVAIRANLGRLRQAFDELRAGDLDGFNVTMPLKTSAWEIAEEATAEAEAAGAVNTLRYRDRRIQGHSTDTTAFREIVDSDPFRGHNDVLVLGAGGAARAAIAALSGHHVYIAARSEEKARLLARGSANTTVVSWGTVVAGAVVVNATPIGMRAESLPSGVVDAGSGLIDLPYGERPTPAVLKARELGLAEVDGFEFLARQAAESFLWWTGVPVDPSALTEVARNV